MGRICIANFLSSIRVFRSYVSLYSVNTGSLFKRVMSPLLMIIIIKLRDFSFRNLFFYVFQVQFLLN